MMLKSLEVENFKVLKHIKLDFSKLNILIGPNSGGKSSIIQTMLLVRQSMGGGPNWVGDFLTLGSFRDAIYNRDHKLAIKLAFDFEAKDKSASYIVTIDEKGGVAEITLDKEPRKYYTIITEEIITDWFSNLVYFPTNRGYRSYESSSTGFGFAEKVSEYSYDPSKAVAESYYYFSILSTKSRIDPQAKNLFNKINSRVTMIDPELKLRLDPIEITGFNFGVREKDFWESIVNAGFGLNQAIYVIALSSLALEGSTILLEEPEISLHPRAQSGIAKAIADISKKDEKQFIITTHSEHLLDGLAKCVLEGDLKPEDMKLYYIEKEEGKVKVDQDFKPREIRITEDGGFEGGLPGFFDYELEKLKGFTELRMRKQYGRGSH